MDVPFPILRTNQMTPGRLKYGMNQIESNGMLVNRNKPGPVITDWKQYSDRALKMTGEGKVIAFYG